MGFTWLSTYAEADGSEYQVPISTCINACLDLHTQHNNIRYDTLLHNCRITQPAANMPKIVRLTLFKIDNKDTVQEAINMYSTLAQDATKVR